MANHVYNSQLVSYISALDRLHTANYGAEDAFDLYHQVQEQSKGAGSLSGGPARPALGHAVAGSVATATTKILLYPLDLVITRLQVQRQLHGPREAPSAASDADAEYSTVLDAVRKIYAKEGGLKAFYTGCIPDTTKSLADSFLFFLAYTFLRQRQQRKLRSESLSIFDEMSVGMAAGAFARFITTPIQNIVTRQQTAAMIAARDPLSSQSNKLSIKDVALQIRAERGIQGFWSGYSASLILTLNPALTFVMQNLLKKLLPRSRRDDPGARLTFLIAACSKVIATSITYPVALAKSRAQIAAPASTSSTTEESMDSQEKLEKTDSSSSPSYAQTKQYARKALRILFSQQIAQLAILKSLRKIYHTEGIIGLYSGLEGEILKGFLSHGFTMLLKETIHVQIIKTYSFLLSLTKRWPKDLQKAQDGASAVAVDARQRAENVGETVLEGGRRIVERGKEAIGSEK